MTSSLDLPAPLQEEFAGVVAVWNSGATTRGVDALVLSWVKYEKQLRRLFCFLVFQHPGIGEEEIKDVVETLAENHQLYAKTFILGIQKLGVESVKSLLKQEYESLSVEIERIRKIRNKLAHGQTTGERIKTEQLECDINWIVKWISGLADSAQAAFGYNGLKRNTFKRAKAASKIVVATYPFSNPQEFKVWLTALAKDCKKLPKASKVG